jgi:3-oxoacyl-[acyl-carrier protein] reductase
VASRNITVNAVAPGYIATDMTKDLSDELKQSIMAKIPLARMGTPEDVAAAVKFLAGDEASYITGQVIAVNGGMYM